MHKSAPKLLYQINASVSRDHTPSSSSCTSFSDTHTPTERGTPTSFHCIAECISTHLTRRDKKQAAKNCQPDKSSIETENVRDCAMGRGRGLKGVLYGVSLLFWLVHSESVALRQWMFVVAYRSVASQRWLINVAWHFGPKFCDNNLLLLFGGTKVECLSSRRLRRRQCGRLKFVFSYSMITHSSSLNYKLLSPSSAFFFLLPSLSLFPSQSMRHLLGKT